jgi:hypothetical protein
VIVELACELIDLGPELSALILDASGKAVHPRRKTVYPGVEARAEGVDPVS